MSDLTAFALPWASLALLGAIHGVNPGMGWLFAVALGLQERSRAAVLRALGPIAFGHAISIGVVATAVAALQLWTDASVLKTVSALALIGFGAYRLLAQNAHPRWVGMRVTGRDLAVWSFLMATAQMTHTGHTAGFGHVGFSGSFEPLQVGVGGLGVPGEVVAVLVHSAAMLLVMALVALLVFDKLGLAILRHAWLNIDRLWAGGLVGVGVLTLLI